LAQRLLRGSGLARRRRHHGAVTRAVRRADATDSGPRGSGRRRGSTLARSGTRHLGSHEARRRPAAAPAHDGGDGPTGLRTMRIQLRGLFRRYRGAGGGAAESVRAGRQGNRPYAEDALPGVRRAKAFRPGFDCPCYGCTSRRRASAGSFAGHHTGPLARSPG
jgi:hypothetical protein